MALIHLKQTDYNISQWSGGTTTQLAIAPEGAIYAQRDFLWRISSATVDLEESDFTALPDYHRWISTLEGGMRLSHEKGTPIELLPYQIHQFDGGIDTHSWGKCTDFNLMLRKGKTAGKVRALFLKDGETQTVTFEQPDPAFANCQLLIFCGQGSAQVDENGEKILLAQGESVYEAQAADAALTITAQGDCSFMIAQMQF